MAAWTFRGSTWNTTAGSKTVTFTPALGDLIVVVAACSGLAGGTTGVTDDNSSGTYSDVDIDRTGFSTTGVLNVYARTALIASATSTIVTAAQVGSSGGGLHVYTLSGMRLTGTNSVRQTAGESSGTAGTTPAPALGVPPLPWNPMLITVAAGANAAVMNPRTGYSEGADAGYNTPATGLGSATKNEGEISATLTFGGTTSTTFASIGIEFESERRSPVGMNHSATAVFAEATRDAWRRTKRGIFVPGLWTPKGATV